MKKEKVLKKVKVNRAAVEAAIMENFLHELMMRKKLEIEQQEGKDLDCSIATSPNVRIKDYGDFSLWVQVWPKDALEYLRGQVTFGEFIEGREFWEEEALHFEDGEYWKSDFQEVEVEFEGTAGLEKKLRKQSWKEELKDLEFKLGGPGLESYGIEADTIL